MSDTSLVSIICACKTTTDDPIHDCRVRHWNDFIESLNGCEDTNFELVLAYYDSDDIEWNKTQFPVVVVNIDGHYNSGIANNTAAKYAKGEIFFFADLDFIMPKDSMQHLRDHVFVGQTYFPIWWSGAGGDSPGHWRDASYGALGVHKDDYEKMGQYYSEDTGKSWGGDVEIFNSAKRHTKPLRRRWKLIHQYHPAKHRNFYHEGKTIY